MPLGYFNNFSNTIYSNTVCLDIASRIDITRRLRGDPRVFYPLDLSQDIRADEVARRYYGDARYAWLVYVGAQIVDPYYGWVIDSDSFANYMIELYGSIPEAQQRIKEWRVGWYGQDDVEITVSSYQALNTELQQYYQPIYTFNTNIVGYKLRQVDWTVTTNQFQDLTTSNTGNTWILDERVVILSANNPIGNGQVSWSNSTQVSIQHIQGNTTANTTTVQGYSSNTVATITNAGNIFYNIDAEQQAFWIPISAWDYYNDINEQNRHMKVVDSALAQEAQRELQLLLANTQENILQTGQF